MKKLFRASCAAFAVWLMTVPALADIIDPFYEDGHPFDYAYFNEEPVHSDSLIIPALALGVVVIAAAILARTIIRKRKVEKESQGK